MLCKKVAEWVLSHGADGIPAPWRGHIEECETCRGLIAQIGALDGALAVDDVPDPGAAYWDGVAPSVARRIETAEARRQARALPSRWAWIGRWAPAIGVAALAILVARELAIPPTVTVPLDTDLSVTAKKAESDTPETMPRGMSEILPAEQPGQSHLATPNTGNEGPTLRAQSEEQPSGSARHDVMGAAPPEDSRASASQGQAANPAALTAPSAAVAGLDNPQTPRQSSTPTVSDTPLWPDRRVTIMGEIDSSRLRESADDETSLAEQGADAVAEKVAEYATSSAETVGTFPAPNRLESPQTFRAQGPADTPNVTAEFRRLDELQDLRRQIGIIQAIPVADRIDEQNERLCAMWYRVGMIANQTPLIDSALMQLEQCLQILDGRDRENWEDRSNQLKSRRATLTP